MAAPSIPHAIQLDFVFPEPEEWRPVVGWEGLYEVSSLGRVRSLDRSFRDRQGQRQRFFKGRIMKDRAQGKGYHSTRRMILLQSAPRKVYRRIHQLVSEAFLGPKPLGYCVNHIDGNPTNNRAENLEYLTFSQNNLHALETGLSKARGETHYHAVFNETDVLLIRRLFKGGMGQTDLSRLFQVSLSAIEFVVKRRSWKHLSEED